MAEFLAQRYADAYQLARGTIRMGRIIKKISLLIGVFLFVVGALGATGVLPEQANPGYFFGIIAMPVSILFILVGFTSGVIIASQGQMMQAILDSAVNTSPIASVDEKAQILSGLSS